MYQSKSDLMKSHLDLCQSKSDLMKSHLDLCKSKSDLMKSNLDLCIIKWVISKSFLDLMKSKKEGTKTGKKRGQCPRRTLTCEKMNDQKASNIA